MYSNNTQCKDMQRSAMWCILIPDYNLFNKSDKKAAKRQYASERGLFPNQITPENYMHYIECERHAYKLGCCTEAQPNKEETNMAFIDRYPQTCSSVSATGVLIEKGPTEVQEQRRFLFDRLNVQFYNKDEELRKKFNLDRVYPNSARQLVEWVKEGKFTLPEEGEDTYPESIIWRKPEDKEDKVGYWAARKEMEKAKDKTMEDINSLPPERGLEALRSFEAATF